MPNSFYISTDLNVSGNSYFASGITALNYYGNASNLSGIAKGGGTGGQVYYFNLSNTEYPYYQFSNSATTAPQSSLSVTTGASQTAYVGGFITPTKVPGITTLPLGIISFYLHCQNDTNSYNYDVYCELYKLDQSSVETLLFTSDPTPVLTDTIEMIVTDGYFSGATLNTTDRLIVKIYATNVTSSSHTFYFYSEGSEHYSFSLTTIPSGILSINTGTGISASTLNGVSTIVNTDLGSSQNIFKNIQAGGVTQFSAGSNSANLNFSGINVSITSAATNTLVFSASTNYVTGSGTTRYIPSWNGTSTLNDTIIYNATDKIGINTTIPNAILHVQTITTSDEGLIVSGNTNFGRNMVRITQTGGGNALLVEDSSNPDSTPFVINASGNVGIGTDSPTTLLHVSGDSIISGTLTLTTISATTYQNLPVSGVTNGSGISASTNNGVVTISNTQVQGITGKTDGSGISSSISNNVITITNTDLGSSQNIFKNIQAGGVTQFSAGSNSANLNFSGINITITSAATNTLVFSAGTGNGGAVSSVTVGTGLSGNSTTGAITLINTQVQGITGKTDGNGISSSISNNVITITNTDLGSSQNIFKNIKAGGVTQFSAGSNSDNLNFSGINITITSAATNTLVFSAGTGGSSTPFNGGTVSGPTIFTGEVTANTLNVTGVTTSLTFLSSQSVGDEGGQIDLSKPQTNTTLSGSTISIDIYQNKLRFFESGGNNRGAYIDLSKASTGVTSNIIVGLGTVYTTGNNLNFI